MTPAPERPLFTVVMATWGRARHIVPSVRSVLGQSFRDYELIVVGDGCADETEAVVAGFADQGVRWINLPDRSRSQSAPNNAGIAAAAGQYIAYLGHDDLWAPNHLAEMARVFANPVSPDFAVSGLIAHLPGGLPGGWVTGLFTEDSAIHRYTFPPCSLAHRRDVTDRIGGWRQPQELRAPLDEDFLLRATAADLSFVSTGVVTVHKFTASQRYLSYVQQRSDEQEAMLADLVAPGHANRIARKVAKSRLQGAYMTEMTRRYDHFEPGQIARESALRRGLLQPTLKPLGTGAVIRQRPESCALDWRKKPVLGIRFNGRNPQPRFLLPFTATGPALLSIRAVHPNRLALGALELWCNDEPVDARISGLRPGLWGWTARYEAVVKLKADHPSVLEFRLDKTQRKKRKYWIPHVGFGLGKLWLRPLKT